MINKKNRMKIAAILILFIQIESQNIDDAVEDSNPQQFVCQNWSQQNILLSHSKCTLKYKICQEQADYDSSKVTKFQLISCFKRVCITQKSEYIYSNFNQQQQRCIRRDQQFFSNDKQCFQKCCFYEEEQLKQTQQDYMHDDLLLCIDQNLNKNALQTKKILFSIIILIVIPLIILAVVCLKGQIKYFCEKIGRCCRRICSIFVRDKTANIDKIRSNINAADKQFNEEIEQNQQQQRQQSKIRQQENNNPNSQNVFNKAPIEIKEYEQFQIQ